jgi:hypothetical protein
MSVASIYFIVPIDLGPYFRWILLAASLGVLSLSVVGLWLLRRSSRNGKP